MSRRYATVLVAVLGALALGTLTAPPAHAVHLFPLTPVFDPLGHDCAKALTADPGTSAGKVSVVGFNFIDAGTRTSTTNISAGQSVTWTWLADHCHSVTFADGSGTFGAPGFAPPEPQLVRMNGSGKASFTTSFATPGEYLFFCVHHAKVGMTGRVVVT